MVSQKITPVKAFVAVITCERLLVCVPSFMVFQISLRIEAFLTVLANVRPFFEMNSLMNLKILFFTESLSTARIFAFEWLCAKM